MRAKPSVNLLHRGEDPQDSHANGDYSASVTDFTWGPAPMEDFLLSSLDVVIVDVRIHANGYGGDSAPLTNGIEFLWRLDGEELPADAGVKVRLNREWVAVSDNVEHFSPSSGDQMLRCRIAISSFFQDPVGGLAHCPGGILLQGHRGDRVIMRLNDDFTFLVDHVFIVRGGRYLDWISKSNQSS
jgi:hypothetical protein